MNKKIIKSSVFLSVFSALFYVYLNLALAETRYYRSDTWMVNSLLANKLQTTNSTTFDNIAASGSVNSCSAPRNAIGRYQSEIFVRHADGTFIVLGGAQGKARTSRTIYGNSGNQEGYQSATWVAPETALAPTDAVEVNEYVDVQAYCNGVSKGAWSRSGSFLTEQLGASRLNASTWTFTRYTNLVASVINQNTYFNFGAVYYGNSTYNTKIDGFSYSTDIGLRIYDGATTTSIAAEPLGALTSPLRIFKNGNIYGIVLVSTTDAMASKIRIMTSSGVKALRKY
jgi:hypothetical protein